MWSHQPITLSFDFSEQFSIDHPESRNASRSSLALESAVNQTLPSSRRSKPSPVHSLCDIVVRVVSLNQIRINRQCLIEILFHCVSSNTGSLHWECNVHRLSNTGSCVGHSRIELESMGNLLRWDQTPHSWRPEWDR